MRKLIIEVVSNGYLVTPGQTHSHIVPNEFWVFKDKEDLADWLVERLPAPAPFEPASRPSNLGAVISDKESPKFGEVVAQIVPPWAKGAEDLHPGILDEIKQIKHKPKNANV